METKPEAYTPSTVGAHLHLTSRDYSHGICDSSRVIRHGFLPVADVDGGVKILPAFMRHG